MARRGPVRHPQVKVTIRIRDSMRAQLKAIAAQRRTSVQQLIIDALEQIHPELSITQDPSR
jgi:predicted HicB family RNase H-like nuclease